MCSPEMARFRNKMLQVQVQQIPVPQESVYQSRNKKKTIKIYKNNQTKAAWSPHVTTRDPCEGIKSRTKKDLGNCSFSTRLPCPSLVVLLWGYLWGILSSFFCSTTSSYSRAPLLCYSLARSPCQGASSNVEGRRRHKLLADLTGLRPEAWAPVGTGGFGGDWVVAPHSKRVQTTSIRSY